MARSFPSRIGLVLGLSLGGLVVDAVVAPTVAHAEDAKKDGTRDQRAERRVMKATQVDMAQQKSAEMREKAREARKQAMVRLKDLIKGFDGGADQKAEMIMRLSDLYFEEGRDVYLTEMGVFQIAYDACFNSKTPCNPDDVKVEEYTKESREWQNKSIKYYEQILTNYPTFPRADEALFYLGQALQDVGRKDEANDKFTKLVKDYSDSKNVTDAYVLIGEYFFDKNEAFKALTNYKKAVDRGRPTKERPAHEKYAFAMYKLAWCYFNVGEGEQSIKTMQDVVAHSMKDATVAGKGNIQLQEEALKDLVRFFADADKMDEAYAYFNKLGKQELISDMLRRLGATYVEQGKFDRAIETYKRLINDNPMGPKAPEFQDEIIQAWRKMGKKTETLGEIDRLRKSYGKTSQWARENAANQDAVKASGEALEKNLRSVATEYHNEARKLKTGSGWKAASEAAQQAYETYLDEFPNNDASYDIRYQYSELLYALKKHDLAYEQYMQVVKLNPKGKHSRFCAESSIFAADEMVKRDGKSAVAPKLEKGQKPVPFPLTEWEQKGLDAMVQFEKMFPDDKNTRKIIYRAAYLLYNHNQFKDASDRFRVVIGMDPKSKEAEQAANLILDSFTLVDDFRNLKEVSKAFRDQQGLGSPEFKKEVAGVYERASLQIIDVNLQSDKDEMKAAAAYQAFYVEFPGSDKADFAINNASVYLRKAGKVRETILLREELISKFPTSKYYKDQVANLGFDYESIADFKQAADWYEKLFVLDKAHPGSADALFSAALFRNALGDWETSVKDYQQFMAAYPEKPGQNGLKIEIAKTYEERGKLDEASKQYQVFFSKPPTGASADEVMFTRLRYGLLLPKLGQGAKQAAHWKETLQFFEKSTKDAVPMTLAPAYVAQIKYMDAESQYEKFMAMKIAGPEKKMRDKDLGKFLLKQLTDKAKALKGLEGTYVGIYKLGAAEYGLASLVKLGQAYENMSETLMKSYVPVNLTDEQREFYTMGLADKAFPQVEKAVNQYKEALRASFEANLYNADTDLATKRLGELRPDEYPGFYETLDKPLYTATSVKTASFETEP